MSGSCAPGTAAGPCVGVFFTGDATHPSFVAFREALRGLGHVEGVTLHLEPRFTEDVTALPALAAELVARRPDVIAVIGAITLKPLMRATSDIPLVFTVVLDPVATGLVADARRPGGNVTGVTNFDPGQAREQIRILKQLVPGLATLAIVGDADVPPALEAANRAAAVAEGITPHVALLRDPAGLADAFAGFRAARAQALLALEVPFTRIHGAAIAAHAGQARLPTLFGLDMARHAPLLAYGTSLAAAARAMAGMVDRVLKGERPAEMPIETVASPELVINLQVARAIGATIPPALLARAGRVVG